MSNEHDHEAMPEGEEKPPPGVHVMAAVRWLIVLAMALAAFASVTSYFGWFHHAGATDTKAVYYCPMHPGVQQDHPGECPICSMTLVLKTPGGVGGPSSSASSMSMSSASATAAKTSAPAMASASAPYYCPMHPEQTSKDPNAKCPICGMKMVPRPAMPTPSGSGSASSTPPPVGVPGLIAIDLSFDRIQLIGMKTAKAMRTALGTDLRTVGVIAAPEGGLTKVNARVSGWIEHLFVTDTGAAGKAGQPLAAIYSPQILVAEQELFNAQKLGSLPMGGDDAGVHDMPSIGGFVADARTRLELLGVSKGEIAAIEKEGKPRKTVTLYAPRGGFVLQKNAIQGLYFQPGTELFTLGNLSKVWMLADVYEYEAARVKVGEAATMTSLTFPGEAFTAKVTFVYPTVDPSTRTLRIRLELPNADLRLKPGMYGDVKIALPTIDATVIPTDAVVDTGELQYVFVLTQPGHFEPRRVRVGTRTDGKAQILEGVAEGEVVVTTGNFLVDSESRLRATIEGVDPGGVKKPMPPGGGQGSTCDTDFDKGKYGDKWQQCRQCEIVHRGMGTMEQDCKNAIEKPWK